MMMAGMEPLTWADASLGDPMLNFFRAIAYNVHEIYQMAVDADGGGWALALDVDNVPSKYLDWLGQFVGIDPKIFRNVSNLDKRTMIKDAPGWKRGTRSQMIKAAQATLTGNKTVICYERYDPNNAGDRAYHITFITYLSETPDSAATLAALVAAKPAALQFDLLSRAGQIYQTLRDHYPLTTQRLYSNVRSEYADYERARDVVYY
jgi:hypothetical protein